MSYLTSSYIKFRKLLTKLHLHAHLDMLLTSIAMRIPLPLIFVDKRNKFSLGFYSLIIIEDIKNYDKFFKPEKGNIVVDAGAHVGVYTCHASKLVGPEGLIIAIEPDPDNFRKLLFHIALNHCHNVIPLNVALGDKVGKAKLYRFHSAHNVICIDGTWEAPFVEVPIITLDLIIEKLGIPMIDILKMDVEGSELIVLKGIGKTTVKNIVMEYHGELLANVCKYELIGRGYRVMVEPKVEKRLGYIYANRE